MNDIELRAAFERLVAARGAGRDGCVSPDELMRLAEGDATEDERLAWLSHVAGCRACRRELELVRAVADTGQALGARRRPVRMLALAASVILLIGAAALWRSGWLAPDVVRGPGAAVTLVAPRGPVTAEAARRLEWRAVAGAALYEVELLDAAGAVVYEGRTTDTVVALPFTTLLQTGTAYHWRVTALLQDGRREASRAESLRVVLKP